MRTPPGLVAPLLLACGVPTTAATDSEGGSSGAGATTEQPTTGDAPSCAPGSLVCVGDAAQAVCGADGQPGAPEPCSGTCLPGQGCTCTPGATRCAGAELQRCEEGAVWTTTQVCNQLQGLSCDEATASCAGACAPAELLAAGPTATGCDFFAVTATQGLMTDLHFGIVIENPGDGDATVTISGRESFTPVVAVVAAGTARAIELPFVGQLLKPTKGELALGAAYRAQSDRPVRAIQYSTLEPTRSSDSSLLWPRHTWGDRYVAATWPTEGEAMALRAGAWAVVAADDDTMITVTPRPGTDAKGGPGIGVDGGGGLTLNASDVLQIMGDAGGDVTGATIAADRPVLVFGSHMCATVPAGVEACSHMEEAMLPAAQLGTVHVPVPPVAVNGADRRAQVVRVIATDGPTDLYYDPPMVGVPTTIAGTGRFVELEPSAELYALTTSKPVVVAQYMLAADWDGAAADPAMLVTLPTARFHTTHHVHTLPDWLPVDIDITAPAGATVTADGMPVEKWVDVGASGFKVAHVRFTDDVGLAAIEGDQPIAVNVYATGVGQQVSFWHGTGGALAP
jgi:hypothetical protein